MNSSGELVFETYRAPNGPHTGPGVENPLLYNESFRTIPRTMQEIYKNLEVSLDPL
jgi:hypothetical protein